MANDTDHALGDDARAIMELQELLLSTDDINDFLDQLTAYASAAIDGQLSCGITLRRDGRPLTVATSDELAKRVDEVQYDHGEGPCLASMNSGEVNQIDDMAVDDRWSAYAAGAMAHGVRASLSIPLIVQDRPVGAMNFYAREAHAFDAGERATAERLAAEAGRVVALAIRMANQADLADNLKAALASRAVIDQALGVVMAQRRCTADEAFQALRTVSQNRNVKLRDIAAEIVTTISGEPPRPSRNL